MNLAPQQSRFETAASDAAAWGHLPPGLAAALERAAREHPQHGVLYLRPDGTAASQTYPQLLADAARIVAGLRDLGLAPGDPVIFQLELPDDFIPAFWACVLGGFLPAPVSISPTYEQPHSALGKLRNTWKLLGQPIVITSPGLAARLQAFAASENWANLRLAPIDGLRRAPAASAWYQAGPDDLALLLLTSGSTGVPKAVGQPQRNLLAWAASLGAAAGFSADDLSLNWMPLDHVGGLVMFHLRDVVLGCRQAHAPTDAVLQRPLVWLDWIERYRATITWAPNFAFGLINDCADEIASRKWNLSSMRSIFNGGEAIVSRTARRFLELLQAHGLPETAMRPVWGMSETCSAVTHSNRFTLATTRDEDKHVDVGEPIAGIELRIVNAADAPVPSGATGRLQIRGISVTPGYYRNPEANRQAFTADGWFITGDLGCIRDGQLAITGREKDVIIVNGVNFYSHEVEAVVEDIPGVAVSFTAACAVHVPGDNADRTAIFFCANAAGRARLADLCKEIRLALVTRQGLAPDFVLAVEPAEIPKTAIGKIQRGQLRDGFAQGRFAAHVAAAEALRAAAPEGASLFARTWVEAPPAAETPLPASRRVLIIADARLGPGVASRLTAHGHRCTVVHPGAAFQAAGPDAYTIDPARPEDYLRLFRTLPDQGAGYTHVIHAWAYPSAPLPARAQEIEARQQDGSLSLLRLVRAWTKAPEALRAVRLLVVTSGAQAQSPADSFDYAKTPLLGVVRTLPHECPWLDVAQVDLPGGDLSADVEAVLGELASPGTAGELIVRAGKRYLPRLAPVAPAAADESAVFPEGGIYVLSGGLGGIGRALAPRISGSNGKLLILGRRPLQAVSAGGAATGASPGEILRALESAGAQVRYQSGDLTDPSFIRQAIDDAVGHWREPVRAVIHLAAEYHEAPLVEETDEAFLASLRPKLGGAWALDQVAREHAGCRFVSFSSLLGYFGALGTGAYAAANAGLDGFALHQVREGRAACSVLWSLWSGTGMGRAANEEILRARGFAALPPARAIGLLESAARSGHAAVLVGLDARHRGLQAHLGPANPALDPAMTVDFVAPRTAVERAVAQMWQDLLGVSQVGLQDNFFSLGGRSLLAARLFARIERDLGRTLPLATLFAAPTLAELVAKIEAVSEPVRYRALALQPRGSRPPFFCIPGGGSDASVFHDLSRALGPDQPFYGLQAPGLDAVPLAGEFPSVEEVAADFIAVMKEIQPRGPYYFGGHCFGSLLAWEVARQLEARAEPIGLLVLLDPTVSTVFADDILGWDRMAYHGRKFLRLPVADQVRYFIQKVRNFGRTMVVRQRIARSFDQARSMHQRYHLQAYNGRAVIFLADDSFRSHAPQRDPRRHYERLARGGAQYFLVRGDHDGMLHGPGAEGIARDLQACLAAAAAPAAAEGRR